MEISEPWTGLGPRKIFKYRAGPARFSISRTDSDRSRSSGPWIPADNQATIQSHY